MEKEFIIRETTENDISIILGLIKDIAAFEKLSHEVTATEDVLREELFVKKNAEVLLAMYGEEVIGYALFFHNFSTFVGRAGLYVEDVFIKKEYRRKGYGKKIFQHLAKLAKSRKCDRMEWCVLNWNQKAIDLYESLGAKAMNEWTTYRLSGKSLQKLAN